MPTTKEAMKPSRLCAVSTMAAHACTKQLTKNRASARAYHAGPKMM